MGDAKLLIDRSGSEPEEVVLLAERALVGRDDDCDVVLGDSRVSRHHAVVRSLEGGTYELLDLGSSNGTFVNGRRLTMPVLLKDGDTIRMGSCTLRFASPCSVAAGAEADDLERRVTALDEALPELPLLGTSPAMAAVFRLAERAAESPIAVLIEGETGTGKELVARGIHAASPRRAGPFIAVNCAALPESLIEDQLFGHRRGAFTGATQDRKGFFEAASGGTVFLDEIGEMPLAMQAKLLRVLQEGAVTPIGDTRAKPIDVRVISATNRELKAEIACERFRSDLYYRLATLRIAVPPLRERREDIPLLAERLTAAAARKLHRPVRGIDRDAMRALTEFEWPGNVRQLQNEIERAVALVPDGGAISPAHLSEELQPSPTVARGKPSRSGDASKGAAGDLRSARAGFEAQHIATALQECGGNVAKAARSLGLSRNGLQKKLKEYGIRS
jgi:transcriptional regulator with PAS, ATPase and Fis domain